MITLSRIAKEAHVSVSTASKAFSGSTEISEETRELVFRVAKAHGCFKKFYNAKYPKLVIAVIAPEFSSMHYARYLALIQQQMHNCELCVSTTNFSAECEKDLIDYYYKHSNADGMILIDLHPELPQAMEMPVVFLGNTNITDALSRQSAAVYCDMSQAMEDALGYLKSRGISSVGFLGESRTTGKADLFRRKMEEFGMPVQDGQILCMEHRFEDGGYRAVEMLLQKGAPPRALICAYDYMAIGAMRCLRDRGYRIPEDVAILGMDDLPEARYLEPPLASISSAPEQRCQMATDTILRLINGEETEKEMVIPAVIHLRRSFCVEP